MAKKVKTKKIEYKGHIITQTADYYWALGKIYKTEKQAKAAIDAIS